MTRKSTTSPDLLFPLSTFASGDQRDATRAVEIPSDQMPEPYQQLLVHDSDMTSTLESHFGQPMVLRVLDKRMEADAIFRQVLLVGEHDGVVAEFGAIRINLACFDEVTRLDVEACRVPLGQILREHAIEYTSNPSAYLRIESAPYIRDAFGNQSAGDLYGRKNSLSDPDGRYIAQIIEVLPWLDATKSNGKTI